MLRLFALLLVATAAPALAADHSEMRAVIEAGPPVVVARPQHPVLALSFAPGDRVMLLDDVGVSVWRRSSSGLVQAADWAPPSPPSDRIRRPGGLIHGAMGAPDFWVLHSGWSEAELLTVEDAPGGTRLSATSSAVAVPWPNARNGLRFRAGTNLIEGTLEGLGPAPYVAVDPDGTLAVDADGRLHCRAISDAPWPPVGSAVAHPWPDVAVASSAATNGNDAIVAVMLDPSARTLPLASIEGSIRALAALPSGDAAVVLVAVDLGDAHLVLEVELHRRKGRP